MTTSGDILAQTQPQPPVSRAPRPASQFPVAAAPLPARGHSRLGILSFVWSLGIGAGEMAVILVAGWLGVVDPGLTNTAPSMVAGLGLLMCAGIPAAFLGLALGLAGLFEPGRQKVLPLVGLLLNAAIIVGIGLLMLIGSLAPAAVPLSGISA